MELHSKEWGVGLGIKDQGSPGRPQKDESRPGVGGVREMIPLGPAGAWVKTLPNRPTHSSERLPIRATYSSLGATQAHQA